MLDPSAPGSVVFVAPDGRVYVDRDGVSGSTLARWRRAYDPATIRRRARWAAVLLPLAIIGAAAAGALAGLGAVALGSAALGTPTGLDENAVAGAIGGLVGLACALTVILRGSRRPERTTIVPVPEEVLAVAPGNASAEDVWRWATIDGREAAQRRAIGYETFVERPSLRQAAEAAAERYTADYRAYVAVAEELGLVARPPVIDLDDPLH